MTLLNLQYFPHPQYMDMKEIIAEAARKLILEKKVKKLTVKDIVEECQITRQAFSNNAYIHTLSF